MPDCPYGTQVKAGSPASVYLTASTASAYAGAASTWLSPILALYQTRLITTASLCASPPAEPAAWTVADLLNVPAAVEKLNAYVLWSIWNTYCE